MAAWRERAAVGADVELDAGADVELVAGADVELVAGADVELVAGRAAARSGQSHGQSHCGGVANSATH
jgi:hypothetical protein